MPRPAEEGAIKGIALLMLGLAVLALTVLAIIAWDQALDFDPCDNIFKAAGRPCLNSPTSGLVAGGVVIFIGGAIAQGAIRNGRRVFGNLRDTAMMAWLGLCMAMTGAAMVFAAYGIDGREAVTEAQLTPAPPAPDLAADPRSL